MWRATVRRWCERALMRTALPLCGMLALHACATPDAAGTSRDSFRPMRTEPVIAWDCDVPAGSMSRLEYSLRAPAVRITGTIALVDIRPDPQWMPSATLRAGSADNRRFAGFQIRASPDAPESLAIVAIASDQEPSLLGTVPRSAEPLPVSLVQLPDGSVTIGVGSFERRLQGYTGASALVTFACSSAEFGFKGFVVSGGR